MHRALLTLFMLLPALGFAQVKPVASVGKVGSVKEVGSVGRVTKVTSVRDITKPKTEADLTISDGLTGDALWKWYDTQLYSSAEEAFTALSAQIGDSARASQYVLNVYLERFGRPRSRSVEDLRNYAKRVIESRGIVFAVIDPLVTAESSWDPNARSITTAVGLEQIVKRTFRGGARLLFGFAIPLSDRTDPAKNLLVATNLQWEDGMYHWHPYTSHAWGDKYEEYYGSHSYWSGLKNATILKN